MTVSDSGQPSNWAVGALGIEETVVTDLISPPAGPADLLSTVGDLGGFQHTTLTASPAAGAFSNPAFSTGSSIDVAWANPTVMARVGNGSAPFGGYSTDYGTTWAPFGSTPSGTQTGAGNIAVAADGSVFVWTPSDGGTLPSYSANNGGTWTSCAGLTSGQAVVADRVNPLVFYAFNQSASEVYTSINGGQTFTASLSTGIGYGQLVASPAAQGDLWIASGGGLYHSTGGAAFTQDTSVQSAWGIAFGAPATGSATLTIYLGGQVGGTQGVFRSSDYGNTWVRIDDSQHEYGYLNVIQADPRIFGRVYLGTGGRGIIYGDSAE
jgi:hypothetical protein